MADTPQLRCRQAVCQAGVPLTAVNVGQTSPSAGARGPKGNSPQEAAPSAILVGIVNLQLRMLWRAESCSAKDQAAGRSLCCDLAGGSCHVVDRAVCGNLCRAWLGVCSRFKHVAFGVPTPLALARSNR
jgi:hypothetical protein